MVEIMSLLLKLSLAMRKRSLHISLGVRRHFVQVNDPTCMWYNKHSLILHTILNLGSSVGTACWEHLERQSAAKIMVGGTKTAGFFQTSASLFKPKPQDRALRTDKVPTWPPYLFLVI